MQETFSTSPVWVAKELFDQFKSCTKRLTADEWNAKDEEFRRSEEGQSLRPVLAESFEGNPWSIIDWVIEPTGQSDAERDNHYYLGESKAISTDTGKMVLRQIVSVGSLDLVAEEWMEPSRQPHCRAAFVTVNDEFFRGEKSGSLHKGLNFQQGLHGSGHSSFFFIPQWVLPNNAGRIGATGTEPNLIRA